MTLLGTFGGTDRLVPDPGGDGRFAGRSLDGFELGVGKSEVDGVGSRIASDGSPAGFLVGHDADYTVKQKRVDRRGLVLYDKDMTKMQALRSTTAIQNLDPAPWRHNSGTRVSDPGAADSPQGGYTYDPREGYADFPDRFISTRA